MLDIEHLLEESDNKVRVFLRERLKMEIFNGICHEGGEVYSMLLTLFLKMFF